MNRFVFCDPAPVANTADLRRQIVFRRIKASEHTAGLIAALAFPPDPDRDDRHPTASHFPTQSTEVRQ